MNERLGSVIKWIIGQELAISQADIAFKMGMNKTYLSQLVNKKKKISKIFVEKLCKNFPEVNYDYLISGVGDKGKAKTNETQSLIENHDPGGGIQNCLECIKKDAFISSLQIHIARLEKQIEQLENKSEEKSPIEEGQKRKVI